MSGRTINRRIDWDVDPLEFEHGNPLAALYGKQWCLGSHYSGDRPIGAPVLDFKTLERASHNILAGLCFYQLLQDISDATYPPTHREREGAFLRARATCKQTIKTISAKSEQLTQRMVKLRLEVAVKAGNEAAFLNALKEVDWRSKSASEYTHIIDLALAVGAHMAARNLSTQGAEAYPHSEELQKYARVLAPPKVLTNREPRNVNLAANIEWLKANKIDYKGKWVAIKDGELVGSADSHNDLIAQIGETKGRGILVTPVY